MLLALVFPGCENLGGSLLSSNPTLARLSWLSEEEARALPAEERYRWAFEGFEIEAADFRRGVRWRNALKVRNASGRVCTYLEILRDLVAHEEVRKAADDARAGFAALGRALSGGRWYRSGMEAAHDLILEVRKRLSPGTVELLPDPAPDAAGDTIPPLSGLMTEDQGKAWVVKAKRELLEETESGSRVKYVLLLTSETGASREVAVSAGTFEEARVGSAPPRAKGDSEKR